MSPSPNFFFSAQVPTSTTATLEYPALQCWHCLLISVLAAPERRYFFLTLSNKYSQQSVCCLFKGQVGRQHQEQEPSKTVQEGVGCGKRALCRKQQAPPIALVQCNSRSKECSRPSLSSQPSSLPKHSKNVGKEEEVSTKDPQEFPHSGGRVIHATKATLKKGE